MKRGEHGITIIAPTPFKKKIEEQKLDPDTKAKLEAVLNDKERLQQMLNSPQAKALMEKLGRKR